MKAMIWAVFASLLLANLSGPYFLIDRSVVAAYAGSVDSFDPDPNNGVFDIALQSDQKVLIGGLFTSVSGVTRNGIARVNSDGTLDTTFDASATITPLTPQWSLGVQAIEPLPNGQMLVGGVFNGSNGSNLGLVRLNSDGSRDTTFNAHFLSGLAYDILPLTDGTGRIVVAGSYFLIGSPQSNVTRYGIVVLNSDGSLNASSPNFQTARFVYALGLQSDGKIVIGGEEPLVTNSRLHRLNSDFSLDTSFDPGCNGPIESVKIQSDGKILVGGNFQMIGGGGTGSIPRSGIARLNSDGTVDVSFNAGTSGGILSMAVVPDGTIIIGGSFLLANGQTRYNIARLWADGSLEPTFDPGADGAVYSLAVQSDLKLLTGGAFTSIGGTSRFCVGRFEYVDPNSTPSPTPTASATPTRTPTPTPTPIPPRLGNVGGTVKYAFKKRRGIAGMLMTVDGPTGLFSTYTDSNGSFSVSNLPPGNYTVTAYSNVYVFVANPQIATIKPSGNGGFVQFLAYYPN